MLNIKCLSSFSSLLSLFCFILPFFLPSYFLLFSSSFSALLSSFSSLLSSFSFLLHSFSFLLHSFSFFFLLFKTVGLVLLRTVVLRTVVLRTESPWGSVRSYKHLQRNNTPSLGNSAPRYRRWNMTLSCAAAGARARALGRTAY